MLFKARTFFRSICYLLVGTLAFQPVAFSANTFERNCAGGLPTKNVWPIGALQIKPMTEKLRIAQARITAAAKEGILENLTKDDQASLANAKIIFEEYFGADARMDSVHKIGVVLAHRVGQGELGTDGKPARIGTYTKKQIHEKIVLLAAAQVDRDIRDAYVRRKVVGWLGGIAGFVVGGPFGAYAGHKLQQKAEKGTLNVTGVVTGAVLGAVLDSTEVEFSDGSVIGDASDSNLNGALFGAAIGQLVAGDKQPEQSANTSTHVGQNSSTYMTDIPEIPLSPDFAIAVTQPPVTRKGWTELSGAKTDLQSGSASQTKTDPDSKSASDSDKNPNAEPTKNPSMKTAVIIATAIAGVIAAAVFAVIALEDRLDKSERERRRSIQEPERNGGERKKEPYYRHSGWV